MKATINLFSNSYISVVEGMVKESDQTKIVSNKIFRYLLIIAGTIFLGLGIIGIFLPVLPISLKSAFEKFVLQIKERIERKNLLFKKGDSLPKAGKGEICFLIHNI